MKDSDRTQQISNAFIETINTLANIAEDWNDAEEKPDERGRGNNAVGVVIFEDGSGLVAQFSAPINSEYPFSNWAEAIRFKDEDQIKAWLLENISGRSLYGGGGVDEPQR